MADALKALESRENPDALMALERTTPNALRALDSVSAPAQSTRVRRPKRPLGGEPMRDPQREASPVERLMDALTVVPSLQVGLIDAATQQRSPFQTVPEAVFGQRGYGSLLRDNLPAELNVPVPYPGHPMLGVPPGVADVNVSPALAFGGGVGADIMFDPSTYMGVGALTKLGQARKVATLGEKVAELGALGSDVGRATARATRTGRLAPTMAEQARRGERALVSFAGKPIISGAPVLGAAEKVMEAGKALTPGLRVAPELAGIDREAFLAREAQVRAATGVGQREAATKLKPIAEELKRVARQYKIDEEPLRVAIGTAVELSPNDAAQAVATQLSVFGPQASKALEPSARKAVDTINGINAANLARRQTEGIPVARLMDDVEYLRRLTTPEAQRQIARNHPGGWEGFAREITERGGSQRERSLRGMTTQQANELWQTGKLALNGNRVTKTKLFIDDPFVATVMATGETERAIEAARMLKAYASTVGKPSKQAPRGWLEVGSDLQELKGVLFPPEVARTLTKHFAPRSKEAWGRAWRTLNGTWAKWTTGPFPGFHARNEAGDVWNAYVLGGADPRWIATAVPAMLGKGRANFTLGGQQYTREQLVDLAGRLNVFDSSFIRSIPADMAAVLSRPKGIAARLDQNAATRAVETFGQAREASNRFAMFLDGLSKGVEPAVAAERTRTFLFDYGRLPDAVQAMRSNVMPFLAWTYYNAPLQVASLFRKPGAFGAVQKVREEAGGERGLGLGPDGAPLPAFLRRGLPIPIGESGKGDPMFGRLEGFWPGSDIGLLDPRQAFQRAAGLVTPIATAPAEVGLNVNAFRSDIGRGKLEPQAPAERAGAPFASERGSLLGYPVPKRLLPIFELSRVLTELDRMNPGSIFGTNEQPSAFGALREFPDAGPGQRLSSFLFGLRNYPISREMQEENLARAYQGRERDLRALQSRYLRAGDEANAALIERVLERLREQPERALR